MPALARHRSRPAARRLASGHGPACIVLLTLLVAGCGLFDEDRVEVSVRHDADGPGLSTLRVIVGGADHYQPFLAPGEREDFSFHPEPTALRATTLMFELGDVRHDWTGPEVPRGAGYRLRLEVAADGDVRHRLCLLPCSLD